MEESCGARDGRLPSSSFPPDGASDALRVPLPRPQAFVLCMSCGGRLPATPPVFRMTVRLMTMPLLPLLPAPPPPAPQPPPLYALRRRSPCRLLLSATVWRLLLRPVRRPSSSWPADAAPAATWRSPYTSSLAGGTLPCPPHFSTRWGISACPPRFSAGSPSRLSRLRAATCNVAAPLLVSSGACPRWWRRTACL